MFKSKLMVGALLAASALSTPVWAHGDGFGAGALLGLGVGAVLASGSHVVVGAPVYAAPAPVVVYEPEPQSMYVVPEARYRYDDDHWRARRWRHWYAHHRHWDDDDD